MKNIFSLLVLVNFSFFSLHGQDSTEVLAFTTKSFCIIKSTTSYEDAKKTAQEAARKYFIKLNLRNLTPVKGIGLTMPVSECEENGFEYPSYVARGRYDDGEYISIEYSNAFSGFAENYYIVIAASGSVKEVKNTLIKVKKTYKTAYLKKAKVYVGCIH
jgi:hypothetical protein